VVSNEQLDLRAALRQFIATDRFFNVRMAPIPSAVLARIMVPAAAPAVRPAPARPMTPSSSPALRAPAAPALRPSIPTFSTGAGDKVARLAALDNDHVRPCRNCRLCEGRKQTVFGDGSAGARLVFVGEGPGFEEDRQGIPFVGPAGQLLNKMIAAMGLRREETYICNVVKCRPPNNRTPMEDEMSACRPYLFEQLRIIAPELIVALGAPAARTLLEQNLPISRLRGRWHDFTLPVPDGPPRTIPLMPTFHPAYLLRSPAEKKKSWEDLQLVMTRMGLPNAHANAGA
jgi:DNA polymerase